MNKDNLTLEIPVPIGGTVWDKAFPDRPCFVIGYRIGRMMGEDEDDYEEEFGEADGELYIQYMIAGGMECSVPVSQIGKTVFLEREI